MCDMSCGSFSSLIGQGKAKKLLGRALSSGKLAHAYLFRGPDGVGKQLFARVIAEIMNCSNPLEESACGNCSSCKKYRSGNHPDFQHIQPEKGTIRIDTIRGLKKTLSYPPYESRMRVVLLEDIHTMRQEAANSLLKVLEEPPRDNLLILTAESSKTILSTIASRCQTIPFHSLSVEETKGLVLEKSPEVLDNDALLLARLSEGSPGRALVLQKTEMLATWEEVVNLLSRRYGDEEIGTVLKTAEKMSALKDNLPAFFGLLRIWLRDLLVAGSHGSSEAVGSVNKWSSKELFLKMKAINRAEQELIHNCNRTLVCEILLFRLQ